MTNNTIANITMAGNSAQKVVSLPHNNNTNNIQD